MRKKLQEQFKGLELIKSKLNLVEKRGLSSVTETLQQNLLK